MEIWSACKCVIQPLNSFATRVTYRVAQKECNKFDS